MIISYNAGLLKMQDNLIKEGFFEEKIECYDKINMNKKFYIVNENLTKNKEKIQLSMSELGQLSAILYKSVFNMSLCSFTALPFVS